MNYNYGQIYTFPVVKQEGGSKNHFYLQAEDASGKEVIIQAPKLLFQKSESYVVPEYLSCRVKGVDTNGVPSVAQDATAYIRDFYGQPGQENEIYDFKVLNPTIGDEKMMAVIDDYGIIYQIKRPDAPIRKGQRVRGRFIQVRNGNLNLVHVSSGKSDYPYFKFKEVCQNLQLSDYQVRLIKRFINILPELETLRREIEEKRPEWPMTAIQHMQMNMPRWFMRARSKHGKIVLKQVIKLMRNLGLFLLEGSSFLNYLPDDERRVQQEEITTIVEGVKPYEMTLKLVEKNEHKEFVTHLLDRLQRSGFIYHPSRQFATLMLIFRLYPEEVQSNLDRIFAVIFERKLSNWQMEPFRGAFIEQFDIYVRLTRDSVDALPQVESPEERGRLSYLLTAIALELLIAGKDGLPEERMSYLRSLFYRYASLANAQESDTILSKSFLALMNNDSFAPAYTYENLKQPMVMLARAALPLPESDPLRLLNATHTYSNGYVQLTVDSQGIRLGRAGIINPDYAAIPDGWIPWLKPQIALAGLEAPSRSAMNKINERAIWWAQAERALFERQGNPGQSAPKVADRTLITPITGDSVFVQLKGVSNAWTDNPVFNCVVVEEGYEPVSGTISRNDIVGFKVTGTDARSWLTPHGGRILQAKVKSMKEDGSYEFSLESLVSSYISTNILTGETYTAAITSKSGARFGAVCSEGFRLFLSDPDHVNPALGSAVSFVCTGRDPFGNYTGEILHEIDSRVENAKVLCDLLANLEDYEPYDLPENDFDEVNAAEMEMTRDMDEMLSRDKVLELAMLLRFKALSMEKLILAFDYIHFARLLALLAEDERMAEDLSTHAKLLTLTQFFATNDRQDVEELHKLETLTIGRPLLENLWRRLDIVDSMGKPEAREKLQSIIDSPHNELEENLASLALSYTLVSSTCPDEQTIATNIRSRIKSLLNVNYETPKSKYYGTENQFVEFKSSTVFKAHKHGEKSVPQPEEQRYELMHIVAGFLNSAGGILYVGVNDRGYANGLPEDMEYYRRSKTHRVGRDMFTITDTPSLALMIENHVRNVFGESVSRKVQVSVDDEAANLGKEVIIISVKPSYEPVLLDNKLYVRTSTSTRELRDAHEQEIFRNERRQQNLEHLHAEQKEKEQAEREAARSRISENVSGSKDQKKAFTPVSSPEPVADKKSVKKCAVATSAWKTLHLHDDCDGFIQPAYYLYFTTDGKLELSRSDMWREAQDDCALALPVLQDELENGRLIIAFDNMRVMAFNLSDLRETPGLQRGLPITRDDARPVFAATMSGDGFLVCCGTEKSGTLMRRAIPVDSFESSRLGGSTQPFHSVAPERVMAWEVARPDRAGYLSDCLPGRLPRNFGATMRCRFDSPEAADAVRIMTERLANNF